MILRSDCVEQAIDHEQRARFARDIIMTAGQPLAMVRKRAENITETKGAVVLLHGFAQNRYTWHTSKRSFSSYLASEGFDVFTAELRGHGRSRHFSEVRPALLDEHVREDLPAFVREASQLSGFERVFLVGHSMGGLLSYAAGATTVRDRLAGIVSLGSPYRFGSGNTALVGLGKLIEGLHFTGLFDSNPLLPLRTLGRALRYPRPILDSTYWPRFVRAWRPKGMEPDVLDEFLARSFEATSARVTLDLAMGGERDSVGGGGRVDYGVAFRALDTPLLVIAGTEDALAPVPAVRRGYQESGSHDKTFRVFPLGHIDLVLGREAPTTTWPLIRDWLLRHA